MVSLINNIGQIFAEKGEYDRAMQFYRKTLAIQEKTLGHKHPSLARTLHHIGVVFYEQRKTDKALEYIGKSQALRAEVLGPDHPKVADSLHTIANLLQLQGKYQEALKYHRRALAIWEKAFGRDHADVAWPLSDIGIIFLEQNMPKKALESLERVARLCEKKCDIEPYGRALFGLARALVSTGGDKARAIEMAKRALNVFGKTPKAFKKDLEKVDSWLKKYDKGRDISTAKR